MWQYRKIWQRMVYLNHYNYIVMKKHQFVHICCSPSIYFLVNVPKKDLEEGASWVLGMFVCYFFAITDISAHGSGLKNRLYIFPFRTSEVAVKSLQFTQMDT